MAKADHSSLGGSQHINLYTIGFGFSSDWLRELATKGGGTFHTADDAGELAQQINEIFEGILNRTTSFAAPSLSINAFNRLFHRNEVYFSLFAPSANKRWDGNVKRYQLCTDPAQCDLGEVLDVAELVRAFDGDGGERLRKGIAAAAREVKSAFLTYAQAHCPSALR